MSRPCYLFDLDGTLFDCAHRLHHIKGPKKDWRAFFAACPADKPIPHMVQLCVTLFDADQSIVYVSGRSDEVKGETLLSIAAAGLPESPLYMRAAGDHRPDDVLKIELLQKIRADGWAPLLAFDDRNRVVAAWRAAGVPCLQVAPGEF